MVTGLAANISPASMLSVNGSGGIGSWSCASSADFSKIADGILENLQDDSKTPTKDFYQYCMQNKVSNLEEFNLLKNSYSKSRGVDISESKFSDYMRGRGCSGPEELESLNKTGFNTKEELQDAVSHMVAEHLAKFGYKVNTNEIDALVSQTDIKDLASFYNDMSIAEKTEGTKGKVECVRALGTIINKFSQISGISPELKSKMETISKNLDIYLKVLEDKLKKEEKTYPKKQKEVEENKVENNALEQVQSVALENSQNTSTTDLNSQANDENTQKYNANLIANYLS